MKLDALREFDCDALLLALHTANYDTEQALSVIRASPLTYLTVWTPHQVSLFNSGFRHYAGSLRGTYKTLKGEKTLEEVMDYFYRFKIPYQFNRFQDRKREQAVRMLECIESRRTLETPILVPGSQQHLLQGKDTKTSQSTPTAAAPLSDVAGTGGSGQDASTVSSTSASKGESASNAPNGNKNSSVVGGIRVGGEVTHEEGGNLEDWSKTSISGMAISLEERRRRAKQFFLDVEARLGHSKLLDVCKVMQSWESKPFFESKSKLLYILRLQPDLQTRAIEFFPQAQRL